MNQSKRIVLSILVIVTTLMTNAQSEYIKTINGSPIKISELNSRIASVMDSVGLPGLSIAIVNDNSIVYHNVFGVKTLTLKLR